MHFGENQLSRSLIGLSPLSTGHPPGFQPWWVRASTRSYPRFTLPMDRSLRFGSRTCDSFALFGLAFATASPHGLTSPHIANSQAHSSKGTPSRLPRQSLRRIVSTRFQVLFHSPPGVLFTFPSRYLSAIGHQVVFRLNGWSRQIHTEFQGFRVTRGDVQKPSLFVYGGITLYAQTFQSASTSTMVCNSSTDRQIRPNGPTTPCRQRLPAITPTRFSLFRFRSPLLSESLLFSLPVGTEMFHFPTFPPNALCVQAPVAGLSSSWVSPFGNPRITARLPTPRGLSQAPTSFIGSWCQGIHLVLLVACRHKDARVHCVVLNIRAVPRGERRLPTWWGWRFDARHGPTKDRGSQEPDPSGPNSVPGSPSPSHRGSVRGRTDDG